MPFYNFEFFYILLRVFQRFLEPNGCCTLKMESCVCDSSIFSLIQLTVNIQTLLHFKSFISYLSISCPTLWL